MSYLKYERVGILGMAAAVPKNVYHNLTDNEYFNPEDARAIVEKTGIVERRVASTDICASDLCAAAAERLLSNIKADKQEIDVLIFISQTPDYRTPGSGIILQDRLGLPKSCAAYDINLGCSGFIYGLSLSFGLAKQDGVRKVLLLNGETRSKAYSFKDRKTGFLFADAGSACLISKGKDFGESHFLLESFGSMHEYIMIKAGGSRYPSSLETIKEKTYPDGSIRTDEKGVMDGNAVFEFAITEVPRQVRQMLKVTKRDMESIDHVVLHQANAFMNSHLIKKMKVPPEKAPVSLDRFGNTSSVSIPLTMVTELQAELRKPKSLMLTGFGVGLSVATALLDTPGLTISDLEEI
jgi:3-oxoacyl-[acyl-carrier-protein] synthase-3